MSNSEAGRYSRVLVIDFQKCLEMLEGVYMLPEVTQLLSEYERNATGFEPMKAQSGNDLLDEKLFEVYDEQKLAKVTSNEIFPYVNIAVLFSQLNAARINLAGVYNRLAVIALAKAAKGKAKQGSAEQQSRGIGLSAEEYLRRSMSLCSQVIEKDPACTKAFFRRGQAYLMTSRNTENARKDLSRVMNTESGKVDSAVAREWADLAATRKGYCCKSKEIMDWYIKPRQGIVYIFTCTIIQ